MTGQVDERAGRVRLPDGRTLSYTRYGAAGGPVVVVLDGAGSRAQARLADLVAARLGISLIAPDRPGFRGSTPDPALTLLRCADTLAELLDALETGSVGVLAQSLGAPFALAFARAQAVMRRAEVWPILVEHFPELWASPRAARRAFTAVARPWGFDPEGIAVPTTIWAAGTDTVHLPAMARDLA